MAPAHSHVIIDSSQAWRLIEKDYTLRLSLVAHSQAEEHQKAKNVLLSEARTRENPAYLARAWAAMEIADTNKRAEWTYKACCEVWQIQGRPKCRAFFQADWPLQSLFATRSACFVHELELHQTRTRRTIPQGNSAILGHFKREMDRLRSHWSTRLEIAARDAEYQELLAGKHEGGALAPASAVGLLAQSQQPSQEATDGKKRVGRKRTRNLEFLVLAGELWIEKQGGIGSVGDGGLCEIGARLDESQFKHPAQHLEGKAAKDLNEHNRKYGNSGRKIMTWTSLARSPQFKGAMRRMLSRCASDIRK